MTVVASEKVTRKTVQDDGSFVYDQHQIVTDQQGDTITAQVSTLSVIQSTPPVDPGRVVLLTNNASYKPQSAGYSPPATGYAPTIPMPSGPIVAANKAARRRG
jgi:hypothetical protein